MKKYVILLLLIGIGYNCKKAGLNESLVEGSWLDSLPYPGMGWGYALKFNKDLTYQISFAGEGYLSLTGKYIVSGQEVILDNPKDNNGQNETIAAEHVLKKCVLQNIEDLYYLEALSCSSGKKFYNTTKKVPSGTERKVGNIDVLTMNRVEAITTDNVMIRENPDTQAKSIGVLQQVSGAQMEFKHQEYLHSNYPMNIIARTKNKEKVQKWENYWYYVALYEETMGYPASVTGWVFGEFVKIKK